MPLLGLFAVLLTLSPPVGNLVMVTGGRNLGRVGVIEKKDRHIGGFDIVHVKDSAGRQFATRVSNCFIIGKGSERCAPFLLIRCSHGLTRPPAT